MRWRAAFIADEPRPTMAEIVLAGALCLAALLQAATGGVSVPAVAVAVLLGLAVLGARTMPLPATAMLCAAIAVAAGAGMVPDDQIALVVASIVVCYRCAAWAPAPVAMITVVAVVASIVTTTPHTPADVVWESVLMVLPVVAGWAMKRHRRVLHELEVAYAELDASREERAAAAVDAERLRIARELHDVIAHGVSVMVVQAGAADAALGKDATTARRAVQAIERTGTEALRKLARTAGRAAQQ
ncbi:histidine kinase dimerization/phosphoacceptor domain-containing protein [Microbacterium elymi]|uniref:histidine kinase n=1 Tax=Microbacterium elymi TaxID=2909587 RepID=A0ABY5NJR6_9MICO|nr:histidine kinase dimerization/phosphoacceptor domain-containing protein [Microbacterium elymi]UUT35379.1 histidine kinase dimerization/phosphoacceptor domain-containing protein [Microbacterium elymi]